MPTHLRQLVPDLLLVLPGQFIAVISHLAKLFFQIIVTVTELFPDLGINLIYFSSDLLALLLPLSLQILKLIFRTSVRCFTDFFDLCIDLFHPSIDYLALSI